MYQISGKVWTLTAAAALVTLTGCGETVGQDVENPAALPKIDDLMWESTQQEGSVTITADAQLLSGDEQESADMFSELVQDRTLSAISGFTVHSTVPQRPSVLATRT